MAAGDCHAERLSPLWCRCDRTENDDVGTPIWKAWWGKGMQIHSSSLQATSSVDPSVMEDVDRNPFEFSAVDLGSFLNGVAPGRILIRNEYEAAIEVLNRRQTRERRPNSTHNPPPSRGVVIVGQPGIGNTCFLWYLLRYRLSNSLPTLFSLGDHTPLFFCESGAFEPSSHHEIHTPLLVRSACGICRPEHGRLWVLIDVGQKKAEPPDCLIDDDVYVVQTTSPDIARYRGWIKGSSHRCSSASSIIMTPWTWEELVAGLSLQLDDASGTMDLVRLRELYYRHGPVPRTLYWAYGADKDELAAYDDKFTDALSQLTLSQVKEIIKGVILENPSSGLSHKIVCLWRAPDTTIAWYSPVFTPLSPYVMLQLVKRTSFRNIDEKRQVVQSFDSVHQPHVSQRWILRSYAHGVLTSPPSDGEASDLQLLSLVPSTSNPAIYSSSPSANHIQFPLRERNIRMFHGETDFIADPVSANAYCIPSAANRPGFDSFIVSEDVAYIFRTTVSAMQSLEPLTHAGYALLKKIIPHSVTTWRYILVVPHAVDDYALTDVMQESLDPSVSMGFYILTLQLPIGR